MTIGRRAVLGMGAGAIALPAFAQAQAQPQTPVRPPAVDTTIPTWPPPENIALWPGTPPGAPTPLPRWSPQITGRAGEYRDIWSRGTVRPDIGIFRPARPDGRGVLVIPGGGYGFVSLRGEGIDVARALGLQGITCFVLSYRLPAEGWTDRANVPLADAQRAMRLIRAQAARLRIDPAKLGVIGFSAGGHLAGSLATLHDIPVYRAVDAADRLSARPAYAGLMYAVSNMEAGRSHGGSRANLLGPAPSVVMERRYAIDRQIKVTTPPLFVAHAQDDTTVPIANGLDLFAAARAAGVPTEAHFFERGGHGFGTRLPRSLPASLWTDMFARWIPT